MGRPKTDLANRDRVKDGKIFQPTPWHFIPADYKGFTQLAVSSVIIEKLRSLDLHLPKLDAEKKRQMSQARAALLVEKKK